MRAWRMLVIAGLVSGCGWLGGPPETVALPASLNDPACREVARQRAEDSAVNGWDVPLQARIARDSYTSCVQNKAR